MLHNSTALIWGEVLMRLKQFCGSLNRKYNLLCCAIMHEYMRSLASLSSPEPWDLPAGCATTVPCDVDQNTIIVFCPEDGATMRDPQSFSIYAKSPGK